MRVVETQQLATLRAAFPHAAARREGNIPPRLPRFSGNMDCHMLIRAQELPCHDNIVPMLAARARMRAASCEPQLYCQREIAT